MSLFTNYLRGEPVFGKLLQCVNSGEGNLLNDDNVAEAQLEFLRWAFCRALRERGASPHPFRVLETGTNRGFFGLVLAYVIPIPVELVTCDMNPESQCAAALLNEAFGDRLCVRFLLGDSRQTLPLIENEMHCPETPAFEFAWIDGGHAEDIAASDLAFCAAMNIPLVAFDDTKFFPHLAGVVKAFCEKFQYSVVESPFASRDARGAILMQHLPA